MTARAVAERRAALCRESGCYVAPGRQFSWEGPPGMAEERALIERVAGKRLFFTVTTGRSGTEYLCRVLGLFRRVRSVHEPSPRFSSYFRAVCAEPAVAREFWLRRKLPRIARYREPVYAETSHVACKGFLESLVELGLRPTLLHLHRPERDVALSFYRLGVIPGRSLAGLQYCLAPGDRVFLPLDPSRAAALHEYQLCFWYCLEIAERARVYAKRFAPLGVRVERVELERIRSPEGILNLEQRLDLGSPSLLGRLRLRRIGGRPVNVKAERKRAFTLDERQLAALESEVREQVGQGSEAGHR